MRVLEGRVAVITGGASGIGLGIARAMTSVGMRVVLADVAQEPLDIAIAELTANGAAAIGVRTDVSQRRDVETLAEAALDTFGAVHVLCNNAGVGPFGTLTSFSIEEWEWVLGVDLWGPIHGVRTFLPLIEQQDEGHINATSSMAGLLAGALAAPYNVAKHGVVGLMATLERELRAKRSPIRASVLCPGAVNTGILQNTAQRRTELRAGTSGESPEEGRWVPKVQRLLDTSPSPDSVGRLVVDAIASEKFWIFTGDELMQPYRKQVDELLSQGSLSGFRLL